MRRSNMDPKKMDYQHKDPLRFLEITMYMKIFLNLSVFLYIIPE